jgi:O-antigen ligase
VIGQGVVRLQGRAHRLPGWSVVLLTVPAALLAAWLDVKHPKGVELPALLLLSLPLLVNPRARVCFIVFGAILVFGSRDVTMPKLLYLFGLTVSFMGALLNTRRFVRTEIYEDLYPLLRASVFLVALVFVSLPVSLSNGVSALSWFRDVHPYVLLAWTPIFAFDAQTGMTERGLRRLIAAAGTLGALVFSLNWLARRGIVSSLLPAQLGLANFLLAAALFSFAIAVVLDGDRGRVRWLLLASITFALLATTGTRAAAVLLAAPLAIVAGSRRNLTGRSIRLAIIVPIAGLMVWLSASAFIRLTHADQNIIQQRIQLLFKSGASTDESYIDRLHEIRASWRLFADHPFFGVGPGYHIPWVDAKGKQQANPYVDTPVGFLPDFGVAGLAVVAALVVSFISTLRRLRRRAGERTTTQLALIGFGAVVLAWSVLQVPFEDKGLSTGLLVLLAAAAAEARVAARGRSPAETP